MIWILLSSFVIMGLILLLGPNRVNTCYEVLPETKFLTVQITTWKNLCGLEWTKREDDIYLKTILLNRSILLKKRLSKKDSKDQIQKKDKTKKKTRKKRLLWLARPVSIYGPRILKRFINCVGIERVDVKGILGMKNPALTGTVVGFIQSMPPLQSEKYDISLTPHFLSQKFEGKVTLILHFIMGHFLWCILRTGLEICWIYINYKT